MLVDSSVHKHITETFLSNHIAFTHLSIMAGTIGMPDYQERPGTLTMRGDHMNYSRVVLNSNW